MHRLMTSPLLMRYYCKFLLFHCRLQPYVPLRHSKENVTVV